MSSYERGLKAHSKADEAYKEDTKSKYTQCIAECCPRCEAELPEYKCKTCKWWKPWSDSVTGCFNEANKGTPVFTEPTPPDFGCVNWEGK